MESQEEITRKIIEVLNTRHEEFPLRLTFTFNGEEYHITFNSSRTKYGYALESGCIDVYYEKNRKNPREPKRITGGIHANIGNPACFTPRLESHRNNKNSSKARSTDVLQTLKTKLSLLLIRADNEYSGGDSAAAAGAAEGGGGSAEASAAEPAEMPVVELTDVAIKDGISISKFKLLRGGDALYEKYGYVSPLLNKIMPLYKELTFGEFFRNIYSRSKSAELTWQEIIRLKLISREELAEDVKFFTLMNKISWEMEKNNIIETQRISTVLFGVIAQYLLGKIHIIAKTQDIFTFTLDPDSAAWKTYNSMLVFTGIDIPPPAEGGRRRKRGRTVRESKCKGKRTPSRK